MTPLAPAGIVLVDKPQGITSARAVAVIKKVLGGVKVGHLGTLDPFAAGLLPLCVGEGTKAAPYLNTADKSYTGVVRLGVITDTDDRTGEVVATAPAPDTRTLDLSELASAFSGRIAQVPPAFSAIKRDGVPMYKLARKGVRPRLEAREVTIHALSLEAAGKDRLRVEVSCSKGTYIRSLARDLGERLGCGATLEELTRTGFGTFTLDQAVSVERLCGPGGTNVALDALIGLPIALGHLRSLSVDRTSVVRLRAGQQQALGGLAAPAGEGERARVMGPGDDLVAVVSEATGRWRLERVFGPSAYCAATPPVLQADG
jgi:tRNA pseudouridine55 synthase